MPEPAFDVIVGAADSPVVLHVPHASTAIPAPARESIVLDDAALAVELDLMTDLHTDRIAAVASVDTGAWQFVNRCSRLVIDPERFPDDREEMLAVGMGAVYTRTSQRAVLRDDDAARDAQFVRTWFQPYAASLTALVGDRLAALGSAVIIDVHSYPREALPYEVHADESRPEICLGVDGFHTPDWLVSAAESAFAGFEIGVNEPFHGTYVPSAHFGVEPRVSSLMIEIRRDLYCDEPGGAFLERGQRLTAALAALVSAVPGGAPSLS